jgi:hypothetical protein
VAERHVNLCVGTEALRRPSPHLGGDHRTGGRPHHHQHDRQQTKRSACSRAASHDPQNFREGRNATRTQPGENRATHRPEIYFRLAERFAVAGTRIDRFANTVRALAGNFC